MIRLRAAALATALSVAVALPLLPGVSSAAPPSPLLLTGSYSSPNAEAGRQVSLSITAKNAAIVGVTKLTIVAYTTPNLRFEGDDSKRCQAFTNGGGTGFRCSIEPPAAGRSTTVRGINLLATQVGQAAVSASYEYVEIANPKTTYSDFPYTPMPIQITAKERPIPQGCKNVFFVGSRGSGQAINKPVHNVNERGYGFGPEVLRVFKTWVSTVPQGVSFGTIYNTYPADATTNFAPPLGYYSLLKGGALAEWYYREKGIKAYIESANIGADTLVSQLEAKHKECPDASFVLAGYSQGAMATHQAGLRLKGTETGEKILGTFLVADGDRPAYGKSIRTGGADNKAMGIRTTIAKVIPGFQPRPSEVADPANTVQICDTGDVVCDFSARPGNIIVGSIIHTTHYRSDSDRGIPTAVDKLKGRINAKLAPVR